MIGTEKHAWETGHLPTVLLPKLLESHWTTWDKTLLLSGSLPSREKVELENLHGLVKLSNFIRITIKTRKWDVLWHSRHFKCDSCIFIVQIHPTPLTASIIATKFWRVPTFPCLCYALPGMPTPFVINRTSLLPQVSFTRSPSAKVPLYSILIPRQTVGPSSLLACILFIILILNCNEFLCTLGSKVDCKLLQAKMTSVNFSIPVQRTFDK